MISRRWIKEKDNEYDFGIQEVFIPLLTYPVFESSVEVLLVFSGV